MSRKVLLIYPKTGIDPPKPHAPLAFMDLADFLLKAGYEPVIVDQRIEKDWRKEVLKHLNDSLCACISCFTGYQIVNAMQTAEFIKKQNPQTMTILGGTHPTFFPEQTLAEQQVDCIILGEGEVVLPTVLQRIENQDTLDGIKGLGFKKNGQQILNKEFELVDLTESRTRWDLIDIEKYIRPSYGVDRTVIMVTSRGCPYRCGFCYNIMFNKQKWRTKKAEIILDEIETLYKKHNVQGVYFVEDFFFTDKKRVEAICNGLIERNIKIKWGSTQRADHMARADPAFLKLLKDSGCSYLTFGIESGSQRLLDLMHKDIQVQDAVVAAKKCKDYNITAMFTFMCGIPTETEQELRSTIELIDKMRDANPDAWISGIFQYMAYPGTPLYELAKEHGFKPPQTMEQWANYTYFQSSQNLPWITEDKQKYLKLLSYVTRFRFYNKETEKIADSLYRKVGLFVMRGISNVRWKLRYFGMPFELSLIDREYKKQSLAA